MRSKEMPSSGFTPESDTTSGAGASPPAGRSPPPPPPPPPPRRTLRGPSTSSSSSVGYLDTIPPGVRHWMVSDGQAPPLQGQQQSRRTHAPRACEKCRLSKRKCDKKLPYCDRCMRLNAKCHYLPDPISANAGGNPIVVYQPLSSLYDDLMLRHVDPLETITASQILSLVSDTGPLSAPPSPIAGDGGGGGYHQETPSPDWRPSVTEFFRFIHPWYAVVHPFLFERHIAELLRLPPWQAHAHRHAQQDATPPVVSQPSPVSNSSHSDYHPMSIKNAISGYPHHHYSHHHHQRNNTRTAAGHSEYHLKQLALLVVCMHLITRMRVAESGAAPSPMFGPQYRTARRLLALMFTSSDSDTGDSDAECPHTVELVQCGAILGLYEYGHGNAVAAYRTLGQTAAVASILGIRPGSVGDGDANMDVDMEMDMDLETDYGRRRKSADGLDFEVLCKMEREQRSGLWWGLFILDQFIHKDDGTNHLPFLLETPSESTLLPETPPAPPMTVADLVCSGGNERDTDTYRSTKPQPRHPTSVIIGSVSLGPFQLSAKVSSLLHRALCVDKGRGRVGDKDRDKVRIPQRGVPQNSVPKMSLEAFADLDNEVRRTSQTLLQQTVQWEAMLDCFSMLVSALFTLYLPYLPILESVSREAVRRDEELAVVLAALRFACKLSTDISCKINQELESRSTPVPAPVHDPPTPKSNSNSGHGHMDNFDACRDSRNSSVGHSQGGRDDRKSNDNGSLAVLAAPAGATCYSVIVAFAGLERIFPAERAECREAIAEKFESLRLFSLRWGIAEEMVRQLEEKRGIHRSEYINDLPSPTVSAPPSYNMMDVSH